MANENNIEVDLLTSDQGLSAEMSKVAASLREALTTAKQTSTEFTRWADILKDGPEKILGLAKEMKALKAAGQNDAAADLKKVSDGIKAELGSATKSLNDARRELQVSSEARAQGQDRLLAAPLGGGGSTLGDAQLRNKAVGLVTTALNVDDAQMVARIADAAGKAAERLVKTAEASLVARFNQVGISEQIRRETYGNTTTAQALLTRARIGNEKLVQDYGPGTPQTLSDLAQASTAADRAKQAALFERSVADAENKDRDSRAKLLATREFETAGIINRQIDVDKKAAAVREYNEAQEENNRRTIASKQAAVREYNSAQLENIVRDTRAKQIAINEYNQAQEENKRRTTVDKSLSQLEIDLRNSAEKTRAANEKRLATNTYSAAESENRRLTPENAARLATRDSSFATKYGIEREDFAARIKTENLSISEQAVLLRNLATEQKNVNAAKKAAPAAKTVLSEEDKVAQRRARQQSNNEGLDDRLSENGGATFFGFQARIAANYAIFGAAVQSIRSAISAIVDFDDVLKQFQAITETTNTEMMTFRGALLGIASDSKFSVNEISKVAITLGQTGLSAAEVVKALKPVIDLATASGSSLSQAVESITAVLGAYGLEASRATDVSDVFVGALNRTKLTIDQLQLGIQYAANIARDSGVSFSELTATVGSIAQAGVKSGSTIGTGVRQLLTELSSPTEKFRGVLKELGISLADVNLKTNGLTGVLENLRAKGFTTADALRSLDLRAAAAFSALSGQGDRVKILQQQLLLTSAAAEGSTKANESLSAGFQKLQNSAFAIVDKAFNPMVEALKGATGGVSGLFQALTQLGPIIPIIGTALGSLAAAATALKLGSLINGLIAGATLTLPVVGAATAIGALIGGGALVSYLGLLDTKGEAAIKRLDQLKATENDITGRAASIDTNTNSINTTILQLIDRREKLNADPILRQNAVIEAQKAFGELGLSVSTSTDNIDELIKSLQNLRDGLSKQAPTILIEQLALLRKETQELLTIQEEQAKKQRPTVTYDDYDPSVIPTASENKPLAKFDSLQGPGYDFIKKIITDPQILGKEPLTTAGPAFTTLTNAQGEAGLARARAQTANDQKTVQEQDRRLSLLEELNKLLQESVGTQRNLAAYQVKEQLLETSIRAKQIYGRDDIRGVDKQVEDIYTQRDSAKNAILNDKTTNDLQKRDLLSKSLEVSKTSGKQVSDFLDGLAKDLEANGTPKAAIDEALGGIRNKLAEVSKGVTEEMRQLYDGLAVDAKRILQSEKRGTQLSIENALKAAGAARDPAAISAAEDQIKAATDRQTKIIEELAKLEVINPEDVANNAAVRDQVQQDKENLRIQIEGYASKISETRKRLAAQLLDYRDQSDTAEKQKIDKQISALQKVLTDANTTPAKMQEVVTELNKLLDETSAIAKRRNATDLEKSLLNAPTDKGTAIPGATAPEGSNAKAIIDAANERGADAGLTRYILALAQLESALNTNTETTKSTAKGALQFIDGTFQKFGKGDVNNLGDNIGAGINYTKYNDQVFGSKFGRDPTGEERFILHNQGEGGGPALLSADPNARAAEIVGRKAVTNQAASGDATVAEFIDYLKAKYQTAFRQTDGQSTSARKILSDAKTDKDTAVDETAKAERDKAARSVAAAKERSDLAGLAALTREEQTQLEGQASLVRRALTPSAANEANLKALDTIATLRSTAIQRDDLKNRNRDPESKASDAATLNDSFRNQAQTQAISAADAVGKLSLKVYDDRIDQIKSEIKDLDRDSSTGKYDVEHYNSLKQQLEVLEKQKDVRGQLESYDAQINSLNDSLNEIQTKGLGDRSQLLRITEQLAALEAKRKALQPSVDRANALDATGPDFEKAAGQGLDDFAKSRGIKNNLGQLVDATQQARKQISGALNTMSGAFDNLFVNIFNGSMKAGDALKKFATDILSGLLSQASKSLTNSLFSGLFGSLGGGGGGGGLSSLLFGGGGFGGAANGGMPVPVAGMAGGGSVIGGIPNRDSALRRLMPGEFVLRKSAVEGVGRDNLEAINAMGNSVASRGAQVQSMPAVSARSASNVYVVAPEFPRQVGPNDIIHAIGQDIQTNGQTAKLIKSVVAGY